jgi:hypothetical protein
VGYFYEAVTRPREALLLTRPRIADNGAPWQASPYWDEVRRRVAVEPQVLASGSYPDLEGAASWPELLLGLGARPEDAALRTWALRHCGDAWLAVERATEILRQRTSGDKQGSAAYDGDLAAWGDTFARRYGADHTWSASRLETYRACPFRFYVGNVLGLEPRSEPTEGLDARQLGNIYHRILEAVYRSADDPTDLGQLLAILPSVATSILDAAPRRGGFRATAWWAQTREEIVQHVRDSLSALDRLCGAYVPHAYERTFGVPGQPGRALVIDDPERGDAFRMRGYIDRIDVAPDGRVRIIDYKTGGPSSFDKRAFQEGKKLQLALYALAADKALGLGEVADGFYWHVRHAGWHLAHAQRAEWFTLSREGVEEVMDRAVAHAWEAVRGVRHGHFVPKAPDDGCPSYCPAAAFCWQYRPTSW